MTKLYRKTRSYLRAAIALVLLAASHILLAQAAQSSTDPSFPRTQNQDKTESSTPSKKSPDSSATQKPPKSVQPEQEEKKISPQEAQELFRSVDEILKFASKDTSLPIHDEVKRKLVNRDEVVAFIRKHMEEDEDAQRLRRSELVLKKFGLLPRDFNLETFLVALLREQVAG